MSWQREESEVQNGTVVTALTVDEEAGWNNKPEEISRLVQSPLGKI